MSSHTLVQPAIPPFFCFPLLLPPTQLWSIHSYPFPLFPFPNPPLPCTPSLPALPPLTVWTRCRKLWPFFHTPPAGADPSRWGSDSESGPRRVPGILLYQPRVHRKCCCHHCHRAGLITAHAWTHGHTRKHTQLFLQDQSLPNRDTRTHAQTCHLKFLMISDAIVVKLTDKVRFYEENTHCSHCCSLDNSLAPSWDLKAWFCVL